MVVVCFLSSVSSPPFPLFSGVEGKEREAGVEEGREAAVPTVSTSIPAACFPGCKESGRGITVEKDYSEDGW